MPQQQVETKSNISVLEGKLFSDENDPIILEMREKGEFIPCEYAAQHTNGASYEQVLSETLLRIQELREEGLIRALSPENRLNRPYTPEQQPWGLKKENAYDLKHKGRFKLTMSNS